ncbi:hypothetical protein [Nitrosopumilus ureiphilus]|uniref:hypothetical protein n=1 Tax=Nitrosopumilus ureiphilus TaxID=1470067 RepID=UPI0015C773C3|nr:hypothetical protein [Nitrosopumilus ureiphilus]
MKSRFLIITSIAAMTVFFLFTRYLISIHEVCHKIDGFAGLYCLLGLKYTISG